jgi:hypothetical protein
MVDELVPPVVAQRSVVTDPSPAKTSRVLQTIAKGLAKAAVWAVKHPEVVINIVRQIKADETMKQQRQAMPRPMK